VAKKIVQANEEAGPAPVRKPNGSPAGSRKRWFLVGVLSLALVGAAVSVWEWRHPSLTKRVQAGLPATPDLTGRPAVLVDRLAKAQAGAKSSGDVLASVAELGRLYHANGFNQEAEACWRLLQSEQPLEGRWPYYLADLQRMASDYTAMSALLVRTTELAPDYAPAWLLLAGLQFKTGQLDTAERNYHKRLDLVPGDPYARLWLARVALQRDRKEEARRLIEDLVKDAPDFSSGHNLYAEMLAAAGDAAGANRQRLLGRDTGRFREAEDPWLDELMTHCFDFEQLCAKAALEFQTGHSDLAKTYYERAIEIRPHEVTGYTSLASLYLKLKNPAKARATLEGSLPQLKDSKLSLGYYFYLGQAYQDLKQPAEVVRITQEGLRQMGDNLELYSLLGTALSDLNRTDEAIDALHHALALNPNEPNPNFNLGMVLKKVGRRDEAIVALKRSLILQPTFPEALAMLGSIEMEAGRPEEAERYLRPLLESHPEIMADSRLRAGAEAEAKHDLVSAEHHFREGIALNPKHAELQVSLGMLYLTQGRFMEAREPFEAYHKLQPKNPQSFLLLGQIYAMTGRREEARRLLTEGASLADATGKTDTASHCREILSQL
jgi:HemY protein